MPPEEGDQGQEPPIECVVDFNVDDSRVALVPFLERLSPLIGPQPTPPWRIDLRNCQYLGPDAASVLFALLVQARIQGKKWEIRLPIGPPALVGFCRFSGLQLEATGVGPPDPDNPRNETIRLQRFMNVTWNIPDPVIRLVRRHLTLSMDGEDYLRICMNEVLQNIKDHAQSPVGGIMCARFLSAYSQVRVAIVDRGLGIRETLRHRYPTLRSSEEALGAVFQGGYTAKSNPRNLGRGIGNLTRFASAQGGNVTLISGDGLLEMASGWNRPRLQTCPFSFQGTAVFFTLNVIE